MTDQEFIYIVSNPSIPGKVKVGRTTNLKQRIKQLQTTGVPTPYRYEFVAVVEDSASAEKMAHYALRNNRVARNREFFDVAVDVAIEKITKDIIFFKVFWPYTPKNKCTLKVQDNYTKQAKNKISSIEIEIRKVSLSYKFFKEKQSTLEKKLLLLKSKILPQEVFIFRLAKGVLNVRDKNKEERRSQLLEIEKIDQEIKSISHEIESLKTSHKSFTQDLKYLKIFYKNNLTESKSTEKNQDEQKQLPKFQLHRTSENLFVDLENPLNRITSAILIVKRGQEGAFVTEENGNEYFVASDKILNFWQ
jgi:hypothetical protein